MNTETAHTNVDPAEVAKFDQLASRWWDPAGEFKPLHRLNPLRVDYIATRVPLQGRKVVDVGCGGGILSEALARRGAEVTGIDMAGEALGVARLHRLETGLDIDYRQTTAEQFADEMAGQFDIVACMELLEHVPDPASLIAACARLVKPGGDLFFSTLNRTPQAWLLAVVGAEYLLRLLPKGTHQYDTFIRPSELDTWARSAGLESREITGMGYHPLTGDFFETRNISINYITHYRREG